MLQFIPPRNIPSRWGAMKHALDRAFAVSGEDADEVLRQLVAGEYAAFDVSGSASGLVVATVGYPTDGRTKTLWVLLAGGSIHGAGRGRSSAAMAVLDEIEAIGRQQGCREIRIEGRRGWGRLLPDYREIGRIDGQPIFMKVL